MKVEIPEPFGPLFEPHRYKAFYGGRGSAKSHSFAKALLLEGGKRPQRILCGREVQLSIKDSVKQLLDDQIAYFKLGSFYESLQHEIRGKNGTQFTFTGLGRLTTDQIKSYEGVDKLWVEEAQTISAHSLEVIIPTIRKPGSELWFSWNPRHASDPVDQRFRGLAVPNDAVVRRVNYDENPFFPDTLEEERQYDKEHNPGRYAHIWLGEYEPMVIGAIWDRQTLHEGRRQEAPDMRRIIIGVDPAATEAGDEHGIITVGLGDDGRGYVIDDTSTSGAPAKWAQRVVATFDRHEADNVVIEANQGGDMVSHTLRSVRPNLPIIEVKATKGKHVRAEPIAALYELGRVSHVGAYPELEDQMCQMTAAGFEGEGSPDRVDALVWALTELFPQVITKTKSRRERPRVHVEHGWMG